MIESYQLEIIRKRRAARLFWLIVFVCAFFLYYFFQGYYPDIRVGMRRIFSESGSEHNTQVSDLIRSFGIINIKSIPANATILLGSGSYGNNEKKMSDYGDYTMQLSSSGYLTNTMTFRIDHEKPFFIEKISLLPNPNYRELTGIQEVYQMANEEYIMRTGSGLIWSGSTLAHQLSYSGSLEHIGGKYFKTATGIISWEANTFIIPHDDIANFVQTCPHIVWIDILFSCPKTKSLITISGNYMTGVLDIRGTLIEQSGSISEISEKGITKTWSQTGIIDLQKIILLGDELYTSYSGSLVPYDPKIETIILPLDNIAHAIILSEDMILFGDRDNMPHLIIKHLGDPGDRTRDIPLPTKLSYKHLVFHDRDGNIMIETTDGILFVYRGSNEVKWIIEGDVLGYNKNTALYKKDGKVWQADWTTR